MAQMKRPATLQEQHARLCDAANKLATHLRIDPRDLRHAQYLVRNGDDWTLCEEWEQRLDGRWVEVQWTELNTTHRCGPGT